MTHIPFGVKDGKVIYVTETLLAQKGERAAGTEK